MRYLDITYPDVNNGLGCRVSLWVSGCTHHCEGCHNKHTWSFDCGKIFNEDKEKQLFETINLSFIKGLTLTGGDPLDSYEDVLKLVKNFRETFGNSKDIWLYTGYTFKDVSERYNDILDYVDYIVDGAFIEKLKDTSLAFRGSSNQNIYHKNKEGNFEIDSSI